eukprot:333717_1
MALIDTSSTQYHWVQRILSVTLELMMIALFLFYAKDCFKFAKKQLSKKRQISSKDILTSGTIKFREISHVFTVLTLLTYCISGLMKVLNVWSLLSINISCTVFEIFSVLAYHFGKQFLYIVLLLRVKIAFHGSMFADNYIVKYISYLLYFLIFAFFMIAIFGDSLTITGFLTYSDDNPNIHYCELGELPTWGFMTFLLLDFIISVLCVAIFNYPLKIMLKQHAKGKNRKIYDLTRRYAVLSTTAICSTFFLILCLRAFNMGWLTLIDNLINSVCLLLMSSWYKIWFEKICCCCCCCKRSTHKRKHNEESKTELPSTKTMSQSRTPAPNSEILSIDKNKIQPLEFAISASDDTNGMQDDGQPNEAFGHPINLERVVSDTETN